MSDQKSLAEMLLDNTSGPLWMRTLFGHHENGILAAQFSKGSYDVAFMVALPGLDWRVFHVQPHELRRLATQLNELADEVDRVTKAPA